MRYLMMVCAEESAMADIDKDAAISWMEEMNRRGVRLQGSRLGPANTATSVRVRDGRLMVTDGPFAETKEQMGGIDLIECDNLDEAIEVASAHPVARFGAIEVRPIWGG